MFCFKYFICRSGLAFKRVAFVTSMLFCFLGFYSVAVSADPLGESVESSAVDLVDDGEMKGGERKGRERKWYFDRKRTADPAASWRERKLSEHGNMEKVWEALAESQATVAAKHGEGVFQFPCFGDACLCGKQYCSMKHRSVYRCANFTERYSFDDHLKISKGKDYVMEEFCLDRREDGRVLSEKPQDELKDSCLIGDITVQLKGQMMGDMKSYRIPFVTTILQMKEQESDQESDNEYVYEFAVKKLDYDDSFPVELTGEIVTLYMLDDALKSMSSTMGVGDFKGKDVKIVLAKKRLRGFSYIDRYTMKLSGDFYLPMNGESQKNRFKGRTSLYLHNGSYKVWIGAEERSLRAEFLATKRSQNEQEEDSGLFVLMASLKIMDIGRHLCSKRDLTIAENNKLVGPEKGKDYICGTDICECGMNACDENAYGGARCEWGVDFVNQQLKDASSKDYRACISTEDSELGEVLTTTTP